jgi:2-methylcitrate dehydratase PrpD
MSDETLCERLAAYAIGLRFESIPREVVTKAQDVILHNLAVAFGAVGTDQFNKGVDFAAARSGPATIIGHSLRASVADAAFVNTIATRALRMEDNLLPSFTHPGACLVPTALAIAEQNGNSGRDVLAAIVVGYDVTAKVAGPTYTRRFTNRTPSHVYGALGVAATAARLMRLDAVQSAGALAHACNLGAMITSGIQDFQYGIVTRNGMFAAELGKCRAPFPRDAFEGPEGFYAVQTGGQRPTLQEITGTLGSRYEILSTILKPHPCTGVNLVPSGMLSTLIREHQLSDANVKRIRVTRGPNLSLIEGHNDGGPFTGYLGGKYQATSSLPFALAVLLVDGEITNAHFDNPNDPRFVPAMRKVVVEFREGLGLLDHEIAVERTDGKVVSLQGGGEFLATPDARKILELHGRKVVGEAKITQLQQAVAALDRAPDVATLAKCLT